MLTAIPFSDTGVWRCVGAQLDVEPAAGRAFEDRDGYSFLDSAGGAKGGALAPREDREVHERVDVSARRASGAEVRHVSCLLCAPMRASR
jgi:hypothetical protein